MPKVHTINTANQSWTKELRPSLPKIYAIGQSDLIRSSPKVAIVGSRVITDYGHKVLRLIVPQLVNNNITIVSGGAFGVDLVSQQIALNCGGKVITVLASGIENPTPITNLDFFEQVQQHGLLISEYSGFLPAQKYSFIRRNRIIAGLADLVLIIEAGEKSGSLATANFALDLGIPVACIPGRITDEMSKGTNLLLQQGAQLVRNAQDVIDQLRDNPLHLFK